MLHRIALLIALLSTLIASPLTRAADTPATPAKPNIVYILADDLGFADPGFNGGKQIKTPVLDKLAASGAILKQFYVQPVCSPTRASFMTGRYPIRYGLQVGVIRPDFHFGLSLDERLLPVALKEAGYTTAITGKWHLGSFDEKYWPNARGFDFFYGHLFGALDYFTHKRNGVVDWFRNTERSSDEGYTTHLLAREASAFIREQDGKKPFFLYVPFNAVHSPFQVPDNYMKPYADLPLPRRKLAGMLAAADEAVGQILAALDEKGLRKNTLILFSSDNGGPAPGRVTDNTPLRAGKGTVYEGGVRVCACASWQGVIEPGTKVDAAMHIVDWYPTLIRIAGGSLEQKLPLDGKDIWPCITKGAPSPHDVIIHNIAPSAGAIRVGDWKLVVKSAGPIAKAKKKQAESAEELYNIAQDISEKNDVASGNPDKVKELRKIYNRLAKEAVPPLALTEGDE